MNLKSGIKLLMLSSQVNLKDTAKFTNTLFFGWTLWFVPACRRM